MSGELLGSGEVLLRLAAAVVAGAAIGLNRWLRHKPAGFGTHALVSLGGALATMIIVRTPGGDAEAVSRVIQGLVTGVGFIGAGVIMRGDADREVHGLTTAASIWATAILGIACGASDWDIAVIGVACALVVLVVSKPLEDLAGRVLKAPADDRRQAAKEEGRG